MTIHTVVSQALLLDLDIVAALPELQSLPVEEVENRIDRFLDDLQDSMADAIADSGMPFLEAGDAVGLCEEILCCGLRVPVPMLLKVCKTIVALWHGELTCSRCSPVYLVRLTV